MKFTVATLIFAILAHASPRDEIPSCAVPCIDTVVTEQTSCVTDDFNCICASQAAVAKAGRRCVMDKCGLKTAMNEVLPVVNKICHEHGF
ncbi:uncharacterized protein N7515_010197 [Penicillium bovifimosum]|uniref:CFEM domain-containing protein n=1 Tax=Penicillium bovifimosum TaxID=126998 RepID=A0A9W9GJ55_9EURO|nr:uncharacterized protein N7515_010197 [Penicillium bovifimosum]KAJ5120809.1 hypothetical protein N7515_010197 [Penicillium bovifimosum]